MKIPVDRCMGRITRSPLRNINGESVVSINNTEKDPASVSDEVNNNKNFDIYESSGEVKENDLNENSESDKAASFKIIKKEMVFLN